jgi:hypothetical protein
MGVRYPDEQVGFAISVDIVETERDGREVLPLPEQDGATVDSGPGGITSRQFDEQDAPVQVERKKVTRIACRVVVVPDHGIYLKGTRAPVVPVVLHRLPPAAQGAECHPSHQHDEHAESHIHQPVEVEMPSSSGWRGRFMLVAPGWQESLRRGSALWGDG